MSELIAPNTTPTTTPANNKRKVCCTPRAKASVKKTATTAPINAAPVSPNRTTHSVANGLTPNTANATATPSEAPEALPSKNGSASGLRNNPCATAPAKPSKAPANQAPKVRGARISQTICAAAGSASCLNISQILSNPVLPTAKPVTSNTAVKPSKHAPTCPARCLRIVTPICLSNNWPSAVPLLPCAGQLGPTHRLRRC